MSPFDSIDARCMYGAKTLIRLTNYFEKGSGCVISSLSGQKETRN